MDTRVKPAYDAFVKRSDWTHHASQRSRPALLCRRGSVVGFPDPEPALRRLRVGRRPAPRVGVAIGDYVLELWELEQDGRLDVGESSGRFPSRAQPLHGAGPKAWSRMRARISELLREDHPALRDKTSCAAARWCR